jgi:hypothetical protein
VAEVLSQLSFFRPDPKVRFDDPSRDDSSSDIAVLAVVAFAGPLELWLIVALPCRSARLTRRQRCWPLRNFLIWVLQVIKRRIEALIDREYLERDADNQNTYKYMA